MAEKRSGEGKVDEWNGGGLIFRSSFSDIIYSLIVHLHTVKKISSKYNCTYTESHSRRTASKKPRLSPYSFYISEILKVPSSICV